MKYYTGCFLLALLALSLLIPNAGYAAPTDSKSSAKVSSKNAPRQIRYIVYDKRKYVNLQDVAAFYGMYLGVTRNGVMLFSKWHRIEFINGKRAGAIDNQNVMFLFPLLVRNGKRYISELDFIRVIDSAIRRKLPRRKLKRIVIDPGHGGKDKGAPGAHALEKQINLQIAIRLRNKLRSYGFEVLMTRSSDLTLPLESRAVFCKKYRPDLFLSIHCNASTTKSVSGIETWLLAPVGGPSSQESKPKMTVDPGNSFDKYNYRLAFEIQKAMMRNFPRSVNRGVKHSRFFVLRNANAPAVLMEVGFLSNYAEGKRLTSPVVQNLIVNAIISGLSNYVKTIR